MSEVEAEFLFEARVQLELPPMEVGDTPSGNIRIFYVKGGTFEGPELKGTVLPGGADWVTVRPDGSSHLDVRFCLRTDDGALLYLHWVGRFYVEDESNLEYAFDLDKPDDPAGADRYYFRACPEFETSDERYAWLNRVVAVTKSRTGDGGVVHRVFQIK